MSIEQPNTCYGGSTKLTELILICIPSKSPELEVLLNWDLRVIVESSLTQATDTTNIRLVFAAVKETILQNALKDSGIL